MSRAKIFQTEKIDIELDVHLVISLTSDGKDMTLSSFFFFLYKHYEFHVEVLSMIVRQAFSDPSYINDGRPEGTRRSSL